MAATATAAVFGLVATVAALLPEPAGNGVATPRRADDTAPGLPDGKVGSLSHAYRTRCEADSEDRRPGLQRRQVAGGHQQGRTYGTSPCWRRRQPGSFMFS
ncbi:hypothetical protein GCM10010466_07440 [Planomonospora alba]|uniref:Secreted protein n=1 Tax=Planomonospora alba TaxID=161354 RepID=A0ABP6MM31_9ACTN